MLALAHQRLGKLPVELIEADVFGWQPPRRYDTVFLAFWLIHVPPARFAAFWSMLRAALAPAEPAARLAGLGWSARIHETSTPLLVGTARR